MVFFESDISKCDLAKKKKYNILVFGNKVLFIILNLKKKKKRKLDCKMGSTRQDRSLSSGISLPQWMKGRTDSRYVFF